MFKYDIMLDLNLFLMMVNVILELIKLSYVIVFVENIL